MNQKSQIKNRNSRKTQVITKESRLKAAETIKSKLNFVCPHCGVEGRYLGSMGKKHFENCKEKS
jgi:hypothetical protein